MPTGLLPEPFVSWRIICLEGNAAICPQRLPLARAPGQGAVCDLYLALLGSHTSLAVVIVPLILTTLYRAWRGRFERHKKIARWTRPLWFYVSVTGVVVYWMLYHVYAQVAAR
jgi:uncharacterized membrane protein YozB (DUF420 family)